MLCTARVVADGEVHSTQQDGAMGGECSSIPLLVCHEWLDTGLLAATLLCAAVSKINYLN